MGDDDRVEIVGEICRLLRNISSIVDDVDAETRGIIICCVRVLKHKFDSNLNSVFFEK